jgi:hypothetical protein
MAIARKKVIRIRVSPEEEAAIRQRFQRGKRSAVLRAFLLSQQPLRQPSPETEQRKPWLCELARQGNNLNQIAYQVNHILLEGKVPDALLLLDELARIETELERIRKAVT